MYHLKLILKLYSTKFIVGENKFNNIVQYVNQFSLKSLKIRLFCVHSLCFFFYVILGQGLLCRLIPNNYSWNSIIFVFSPFRPPGNSFRAERMWIGDGWEMIFPALLRATSSLLSRTPRITTASMDNPQSQHSSP